MLDFQLFCFSILFDKPKNLLGKASNFFFNYDNSYNDLTLQYSKFSLSEEWINPKGGALPSFFLGSSNNENYTVFFSNLRDGWTTAARKLSKDSKCRSIQVRLSNNSKRPVFSYEIIENGLTVRVIQLLKEKKWVFYSKGDYMEYENLELYNSRDKKKKLNNNIIIKYLLDEGIDFDSVCNKKREGVILKTNSYL